MFDRTKFQVEVLKDMLSATKRMMRINISDDDIGLTDGFHVIVFKKCELKIRWEDIPEFQYDTSADKDKMIQIFDSNVRKRDAGRTLAKLWSKDKKTISLVDQKFLNHFTGGQFFSNGGTTTVYVYDGIGSLVGLILPVRGEEF